MPAVTTIGRLMVNEALPEDLRDPERILSSDAADKVLGEVARRYPQLIGRIVDAGHELACHGDLHLQLD